MVVVPEPGWLEVLVGVLDDGAALPSVVLLGALELLGAGLEVVALPEVGVLVGLLDAGVLEVVGLFEEGVLVLLVAGALPELSGVDVPEVGVLEGGA
ncbi:MAG: hypothetical protein AMXMBFR33_69850 [Candidatus Xenobia bacterium]